jgi:hypothetical protein
MKKRILPIAATAAVLIGIGLIEGLPDAFFAFFGMSFILAGLAGLVYVMLKLPTWLGDDR